MSPIAGTSNLPVAPRDHAYDAKAAAARIFELCDGSVACLQRGFLWRDPALDARTNEAWSVPFCDVIGGRLHIIPKGAALAAGTRGIGGMDFDLDDDVKVKARVVAIYDAIRKQHSDWPHPFKRLAALTADADGQGFEGPICYEGEATGDGRIIDRGALTWEDGPWPLLFDIEEGDHTGPVVGTINEIERREGGVIWAKGAFSDTADPDIAALVARAMELFDEGAVGVSIRTDDDDVTWPEAEGDLYVVHAARVRHVAIVDTAAFNRARLALVAALAAPPAEWFRDPGFGHAENGGKDDPRLVLQEPERPEETTTLGAPFTVTDDGQVFGHVALFGRCHVGYPGTCTRPPKESAAYRGYLTGERVRGIPTGPLVMRTTHAPQTATAASASVHYDHTGYAVADVTIGPDEYGIWASGALRPDATDADIEILRGSAISGDWRNIGGQLKLVGLLVVNAPGFRVARALAASGALITVGPGCEACADEGPSLEDRIVTIEQAIAAGLVSGL